MTTANTFRALYATRDGDSFDASFRDLDRAALPPGEVLIRVTCSSVNYKDGLAVLGKPGVIRSFPMIPGIDLAGVVEASESLELKPGDPVVVTGCGTSETMWGGYAELARLDAQYIVPLPAGLTLQQAMAVGTAGFTAMQSVIELERHGLRPGGREVLVTGAAGGVGSAAVAILAALGYDVCASTGRVALHDYLRGLGARTVITREDVVAAAKRPLESERWAAAVDSVGGDTLGALVRSVAAGGSVAVCGLAGGAAVNMTVYPLILRGVSLLGIDSLRVPKAARIEIWKRLTRDLPLPMLDAMTTVAGLSEIVPLARQVLAGQLRGRTVIDVSR